MDPKKHFWPKFQTQKITRNPPPPPPPPSIIKICEWGLWGLNGTLIRLIEREGEFSGRMRQLVTAEGRTVQSGGIREMY